MLFVVVVSHLQEHIGTTTCSSLVFSLATHSKMMTSSYVVYRHFFLAVVLFIARPQKMTMNNCVIHKHFSWLQREEDDKNTTIVLLSSFSRKKKLKKKKKKNVENERRRREAYLQASTSVPIAFTLLLPPH